MTSRGNRYIAVAMDYLIKWPEAKAIQRADAESVAKFTTKQDTTQATLFKLVYGRIAMLPVERKINTYPAKPITEKNFQETLENKQRRTADNIQKSQETQKERHDTEKQWSGKFDPKWDGPFHIEEILGNGAYKLRLDNKILTKAAHED
ncbi:hypothetical protein G9A89_022101 [Geosiphon pyriformis]|nr:hypothetical protein G9A89_022101 [Geosiphon pyriformis]